MIRKKTLFTIVAVFSGAAAQEALDENALFADSSSVVESTTVVNTQAAKQDAQEKNTVGFSGEIFAYANPSLSRDWFDEPSVHDIGLSSRVVGNGQLDVRLVGGAKAFIDMEAAYVPVSSFDMALSTGMSDADSVSDADSGTIFNVREIFIDANYNKNVYVRAGKQVLQWGRCFLWNPTDLVNVEKKTFFQKMGHREGTYGIKVHIPYKTLFNFYSFIDANEATEMTGLAGAAKAEVLLGRTEMALSLWGKRNRKPVFGFDVSSQLFEVQIAGEVSLRNGKDMNTIKMNDMDTTITDMGDTWIPRASLNLMKFFPLGGVADRLMVSTEFYYNQAGYTDNIFKNGQVDYWHIITTLRAKNFDLPTILGLYEANSYSKFYGMINASVSRFILNDMTLVCNVVGNFNQNCYMVSSGVDYQSLHKFNISCYLNGFLGEKNAEYTFLNNGLSLQIKAGIMF